MQNIMEYVVIALLIIGAITILRFIWPLLLFMALAIAGYSFYLRYKLNKQIKDNEDYMEINRQFTDFQQNQREEVYETPVTNNAVIDADYTEKEID